MSLPKRNCRTCGEEFILTASKPGNINDCIHCAVEPAIKYMAKVSYPCKNASEVEIELTQNHSDAMAFNRSQLHHWSKPY